LIVLIVESGFIGMKIEYLAAKTNRRIRFCIN